MEQQQRRMGVLLQHVSGQVNDSSNEMLSQEQCNATSGKRYKTLKSMNDPENPNVGKTLPREAEKAKKFNGWGYVSLFFLLSCVANFF